MNGQFNEELEPMKKYQTETTKLKIRAAEVASVSREFQNWKTG